MKNWYSELHLVRKAGGVKKKQFLVALVVKMLRIIAQKGFSIRLRARNHRSQPKTVTFSQGIVAEEGQDGSSTNLLDMFKDDLKRKLLRTNLIWKGHKH